MKLICAWCHKSLGSDGTEDGVVSHGMCVSCRDTFLNVPRPHKLRHFLDSLPLAVLVVDRTGTVTMSNAEAMVMFGKADSPVEGYPVGHALECSSAAMLGGCGNTEACRGCAVRRSVMFTHETGLPQENVVAFLSAGAQNPEPLPPEGSYTMRVLIATRKMGDVVLLRIDQVTPVAQPAEMIEQPAAA